jgi:hypothetical protein
MLSLLREKFGIAKIRLSDGIINFFSNFKYFLVSSMFLITIAITIPIFGMGLVNTEFSIIGCAVCPARIISPLFGGGPIGQFSLDTPIYSSLTIIGVSFLLLYFLGLISPRSWCKICPLGAMLSLFNKGSLVKMEKDVKKCTKCGICKRVCPMQIKEVYEEKEVNQVDTTDCIKCFDCTEHCPERNCLEIKFFRKTIFRSGDNFKNKFIEKITKKR